jgi:DNA/RNA endonuclease G (NUC1)
VLAAAPAAAFVGWDNCSHVFADAAHPPPEPPGAIRLCRDGFFAVSYDVEMVNPAWAAYQVSPAQVAAYIAGRHGFRKDPDLTALGAPQASPSSSPAYNSTWNLGHLAPSRVMSFSAEAKYSTYTIANAAPQFWSFNQQEWRVLEDRLFDWIAANRTLAIVTGVWYADRATAPRAADNVSFPQAFWKAVCDPAGDGRAGASVAFVGMNEDEGAGTADMRPVAYLEEELLGGARVFPEGLCATSAAVDAAHWWMASPYRVVPYERPTTTAAPTTADVTTTAVNTTTILTFTTRTTQPPGNTTAPAPTLPEVASTAPGETTAAATQQATTTAASAATAVALTTTTQTPPPATTDAATAAPAVLRGRLVITGTYPDTLDALALAALRAALAADLTAAFSQTDPPRSRFEDGTLQVVVESVATSPQLDVMYRVERAGGGGSAVEPAVASALNRQAAGQMTQTKAAWLTRTPAALPGTAAGILVVSVQQPAAALPVLTGTTAAPTTNNDDGRVDVNGGIPTMWLVAFVSLGVIVIAGVVIVVSLARQSSRQPDPKMETADYDDQTHQPTNPIAHNGPYQGPRGGHDAAAADDTTYHYDPQGAVEPEPQPTGGYEDEEAFGYWVAEEEGGDNDGADG